MSANHILTSGSRESVAWLCYPGDSRPTHVDSDIALGKSLHHKHCMAAGNSRDWAVAISVSFPLPLSFEALCLLMSFSATKNQPLLRIKFSTISKILRLFYFSVSFVLFVFHPMPGLNGDFCLWMEPLTLGKKINLRYFIVSRMWYLATDSEMFQYQQWCDTSQETTV